MDQVSAMANFDIPALEAEFNRWNMSSHDFLEAFDYLKAFKQDMDGVVQCALVSMAIVAYARPFINNFGLPDAASRVPQPVTYLDAYGGPVLDTAAIALHTKIVELRNKAVAHSDYSYKPTRRVAVETGTMTWSKPFNPLSENIDHEAFKNLAWRLNIHCVTEMFRLNSLLNSIAPPTGVYVEPQEGEQMNLRVPLTSFKPETK